jgi:hypothetical protein
MARPRTNFGKTFLVGVIVLLLCSVVVGELPELLTLTDNATNDFTVVGIKSLTSFSLLAATKNLRVSDMNSNTVSPALVFSHAEPFAKEAHTRSGYFVLDFVLRT